MFFIVGFFCTVKTDLHYVEEFTADMSMDVLHQTLSSEIPYLKAKKEDKPISAEKVLYFAVNLMTGVDINDKTSLIEHVIPGLSLSEGVDLTEDTSLNNFRSESPLPLKPPKKETLPKESPKKIEISKKDDEVFIYNTHNTESWVYVTKDKNIKDAKTNITLVSERLSKALEKRGVKTIVDKTDHQKMLSERGLPYVYSYAMSNKTVKAAMKRDKNIHYIFDLHIDSASKEETTTIINGKSYARLRFIIGLQNPNWEENSSFAKKIHYTINEKYPKLSKGVLGKGSRSGNGEYNQSLSPYSILIEVGGNYNTQEEINNTVSALADVIADIYFEKDKKVNTSVPSPQKR
jgi:stage II sporulation protein P